MYPTIEKLTDGELLLIDKPINWTSFDVIGKLRYHTHIKMGHAGTLDPLATGLLLICTGKATKKINEFIGLPKTYEGTITLGATTPSYDLESVPENFKTVDLKLEDIEKIKQQFVGHIKQMPPMHSAIKKGGKKLYEYARKGIEIKVEPRDVFIESIDILKYEDQKIHFRVHCGSGTYIRSLAHDLGKALNCGGFLSSLRRTKIGEFCLENSLNIAEMIEHYKAMNLPKIKRK